MHRALFATLISAVALLPAVASARPMTPEDVARIASVGAMAVSPDGTRIAYTRISLPDVTRGEENGTARRQLFLADGPGQARAFLPPEMNVTAIRFSPDGQMITFLWAEPDGKRALWGIPVDGGAHRKLAEIAGADVLAYALAPDGASAWLLATPAADPAREAAAEAGFNARIFEEEHRFNRLFAVTLGDSVDTAPRAIAVPGQVDGFRAAPDGSFLAITTAPTPLVDDNLVSRRINILDPETGALTVVATPGKIDDYDISPDGTQIALIAAIDENDPAATTLHLVDVATGSFRAIDADAAHAVTDAEWLADGRLATIIQPGTASRLRFHAADGAVAGEVDPGGLILTDIGEGGNRITALANAPAHPGELFLFDGSSAFERWTTSNPWLAEIDFGAQRSFTYTASDGQAIEGVLIEPVGGVPAGGAPLILDVHGGPEAHESNGWATGYGNPGQVAAGAGYGVFLPNYRGSTAYGVAFSKAHQGDFAGREFDDLVDAKAALVAAGIADPARTGITGGSYGGFASAWGATAQSAEFAASVMFVGLSNNISKFGTTDIPREMYLVHERGWPWERWQYMLERSPVYHVGNADTPILILHGDADPRVHPTQSLELYRHFRTRRPEVPARLVFYPGEGHGNAHAAARYDYNLRMMQWFDTYLKTGDRRAPMPAPRPELPDGVGEAAGAD